MQPGAIVSFAALGLLSLYDAHRLFVTRDAAAKRRLDRPLALTKLVLLAVFLWSASAPPRVTVAVAALAVPFWYFTAHGLRHCDRCGRTSTPPSLFARPRATCPHCGAALHG
jgi:hypothetical protein